MVSTNLSSSPLSAIMLRVCLALLPGMAAMIYVWGWGVVWNLVLSTVCCLTFEFLALTLRGKQPMPVLRDGSALVTAWLIAICLPPFTSILAILTSALVAIGLVKHAYGGLGRNIFNPAMAGYAAILVSFPLALSQWPNMTDVDGLSGATLLTEFRYRSGLTTQEFIALHHDSVTHQELLALAFLLGGGLLVRLKVIHWRAPAAVFTGIALGALVGYDQGSSSSAGGLFFHLTTGGTIIAAFFVVTDPVTLPSRKVHQWAVGIGVGVMIYLVRTYGAYPDGIAFAVLLANCITPLLDRYQRSQSTVIATDARDA